VAPTAGKRGAVVTLTGRYFGAKRGSSVVAFGKVKAKKYVSWSATKVRVKVPAKAKLGKVKVTLTVLGKTSAAKAFRVRR
jgi:hypothetical protein